MAPLKRKTDHDAPAAKKARTSTNDGGAKRSRKSDVALTTAKSQKPAQSASVFKDEERSFPRGGASVLTPMEHKQIQIKANQDVLFEQSGKKRSGEDDPSDGGSDIGDGEGQAVEKKKRPKKSKKAHSSQATEEQKIKVESMSYKRLVPGSIVLGQVVDVTPRDIVLALPNNLNGYVPLTAISEKLTERIERVLGEQDLDKGSDDGSNEFEDIDLKSMFFQGQYLRACVVPGDQEDGLRNKKRIELSILPHVVNRGITKSSITTNASIQASVISNEDHGLVMDLGLEDYSIKGFLPKSQLGRGLKYSDVQEGAVFLCIVSGTESNGRIIKLCADPQKCAAKSCFVSEAKTVDVFLPGTAVDMLVSDNTETTITGKIMGMLNATADIVHSGAVEKEDIDQKHRIASRVKARIICTFPDSDPKKVAVSLLDHVLALSPRIARKSKQIKSPLEALPISSFIERAKVIKVDANSGLYLDLGAGGIPGFAHISRISDDKIDTLLASTGPYKLESTHRARVIGYNPIDGLYQVSLEPKVLDQPFIRIEDIKIGQIVKGKVQKLIINKKGAPGVVVSLSEGITAYVSDIQLADVRLQHPERKFRDGVSVTGRVLRIDAETRQIQLTLKKSLVNSETQPWSDFASISEGDSSPGTLVDVKPAGAVVQFFSDVTAWLPANQMSEAVITDASRHFQRGQVVNVRVLSVDPESQRMLVSCKSPDAVGPEREAAFRSLTLGHLVHGTVIEKTEEMVTLDVGDGVKAFLRIGHLSDSSEKKEKATISRIRVGSKLEDLVVVNKHAKARSITVSNKRSLRKAAKAGSFITNFEDVREGETIHGFVRLITPDCAFIEFGGGIVGALFKSQVTDGMAQMTDFGLRKDQSIAARVIHIDATQMRFRLSVKEEAELAEKGSQKDDATEASGEPVVNSVDASVKSTTDLTFGTCVMARIRTVKNTQINVHLADNVQGRVSVAEVFENWDDIIDKKNPLGQYKMNERISVTVLGRHDARNHRFLPISHRQGRVPVLELSAKKSQAGSEADLLSLDKIKEGSSWVAFVNNIDNHRVWVNLSANVRGRIDFLDLSDDLLPLSDVEKHFPIGSAIRVRVKSVDVAKGHLELTARSSSNPSTLPNIKAGSVLPARVTKVKEAAIIVKINEDLAGPVYLEQLADDYDKATPSDYEAGELVRVCVLDVDAVNKRVSLSMRPSKVLSSSLLVKDPVFTDRSQLSVGQVVRGFVKTIADNGIYVRLGPDVAAYVRVSELSDAFLKDWKSSFKPDQLVTGKVIANKSDTRNLQLSLKPTVVENPDYKPPIEFADLKPGQLVTGKIKKVGNYGAIMVVDNSNNVSGICHKSEMAERPVADPTKVYKEGDAVKAKILTIETAKRKISFGLKFSYVKEIGEHVPEEEDISDDDVDMRSVKSIESDEDIEMDDADDAVEKSAIPNGVVGLSTSGFDWTGETLDHAEDNTSDSSSDEEATKKKKKHKKVTIKEDRTGDLDAHGPQSVADYERLLLGQPNSAELWVRYMVFQRELNEIEKARQIARRALATMNPREEKERLDVWTALLHLENDFSKDERVEEVFKEACLNNDVREVHERMIKIYISSGKVNNADSLYQSMTKNKSFTSDPSFWLSYAIFLFATAQPPSPSRARALLPRSLQSVPSAQHRYLTQKFAALEFKSANGDAERGRTMFEGLVSTWPKKGDIWDVYLSLEMGREEDGGKDKVRDLFERMAKVGGSKKRRGEVVFKRWKEWEEKCGNKKAIERVKALEAEWVDKRSEDAEDA